MNNRPHPEPISVEDARRCFEYEAATGYLRWKAPFSNKANVSIGSLVGWSDSKGYIKVGIGGKKVAVHRIVWAIHKGDFPASQIDHVNGVVDDNRIENLREASNAENRINAKRERVCTISPYKGVHKVPGCNNRWAARIGGGRSRIYIGAFSSPEEARDAYLAKARELYGDFARVA